MYKVLIAAGGTGGHLFPAQQLIEKIQEKSSSKVEILFAGHGLSANSFFAKEKISFQEILSVAPIRGNLWKFCIGSLKGFWQAISLLRIFRPDVVVGFGSYHTFTLLLASVVLRKKIILFEPNCVLGKVNRLFAPFASKLAIQFPLYAKRRFGEHLFMKIERKNQVFVSPFPWKRKSSLSVSKEEARQHYGLDPNLPTVLVFGGSQGASFLNDVMPKALHLVSFPLQVIHFTGKGHIEYPNVSHAVKPFESEMHLAYLAADVVVCRSGAATIGELIAHQKRALLIPFPLASENHQWVNAHFLVQKLTAASILAQKDATPDRIAKEITSLLQESCPVIRHREERFEHLEDLVLERS